MGGGSSKSPRVQAAPEVQPVEIPAPLPTSVDPSVKQAGDEKRRQLANATGANSTILTSSLGLNSKANTEKKTLLGS